MAKWVFNEKNLSLETWDPGGILSNYSGLSEKRWESIKNSLSWKESKNPPFCHIKDKKSERIKFLILVENCIVLNPNWEKNYEASSNSKGASFAIQVKSELDMNGKQLEVKIPTMTLFSPHENLALWYQHQQMEITSLLTKSEVNHLHNSFLNSFHPFFPSFHEWLLSKRIPAKSKISTKITFKQLNSYR